MKRFCQFKHYPLSGMDLIGGMLSVKAGGMNSAQSGFLAGLD
jgi:hypothetical protein